MMRRDWRAGTAHAGVGIGLRNVHVAEVVASRPSIPWVEVHAENYMAPGPALRALERVRTQYPVSLHPVGLSLGSAESLDRCHLERLRSLVERLEPFLVSEHLSWSSVEGTYLNHLLPLPYTEETLAIVCGHVDEAQEALGRRLLVENPSGYLRFRHSTIPEPEFMTEVVRRTGCGLLCDVNNVYVTGRNLGLDPATYLTSLPGSSIGEYHLAGHAMNDADGRTILIDDHGAPVAPDVWRLFALALARFGPRPTLVEWDTEIPSLTVLLEEAHKAEQVVDSPSSGAECVVAA